MKPISSGRLELFDVAAKQFGVVTREQALQTGMSPGSISRAARSGEWQRLFPGVYALPGSAPNWKRDVKAAMLWAAEDAAVSHRSAAQLLGLVKLTGGLIELSSPRRLRSIDPRLVIHQVHNLPGDVIRIDGIPVTNASRTLIDFASVTDITTLEDALVDAVARGLTTVGRLRLALKDPSRGRRGVGVLRDLLAEAKERGLAETLFENRLLRVLKKARQPRPVCQFIVREGKKVLGRIDVAYPTEMLAIEADSFRFHSTRKAWSRDRVKNNALAVRGWMILRVTWDDLRNRPDEVAKEIGVALAIQRKRLGLDRSFDI